MNSAGSGRIMQPGLELLEIIKLTEFKLKLAKGLAPFVTKSTTWLGTTDEYMYEECVSARYMAYSTISSSDAYLFGY